MNRRVLVLGWIGAGLGMAAMPCGWATASQPPTSGAGRPVTSLPKPVIDMIEGIEAAIASGDIEELRMPLDWNEMKPDLGMPAGSDPIAVWRARSADGSGRDTLQMLKSLLSRPPAVVPLGRDIENNRLFVWPGFVEQPLHTLDAAARAQFEALVPEPARARMLTERRYRGPRLVIGADGVWHAFTAGE